MKAANEWTASTLRSWGLMGVTIEPWGRFGRGWENLAYSGRILTPYNQPLVGQSVAWTGSTRGSMVAPVMVVKERRTAWQNMAVVFEGALVLMGPPQPTASGVPAIRPANFGRFASRHRSSATRGQNRMGYAAREDQNPAGPSRLTVPCRGRGRSDHWLRFAVR